MTQADAILLALLCSGIVTGGLGLLVEGVEEAFRD